MPASTAPQTPTRAVLIGYGSIGRVHARVLATRDLELAVIDQSASVQEHLAEQHPGAVTASSLGDLGAMGWPFDESLAVVATWGPTHTELVEELIEVGCRHILCEKPLADSVARGDRMVAGAAAAGCSLGLNYVRRYGREAESILQLASELGLGPVAGVVVHGGARCLVTNGIHVVEMACDLLGADPISVTSTARVEHINPRSADLGFYGGTAVWAFPGGRELVVSFPLLSTLKEQTAVYFRDAIITLTGSRVETRRRPLTEVEAHPATTWTGQATEVLFDGPLPGLVDGDARIAAAVDALVAGDDVRLRPEHHVRALSACIGALDAGRSGRRVELPVRPDSDLYAERWPIS